MKFEFLEKLKSKVVKLNSKVIAIMAAAVVIVAGSSTAIALAATANTPKNPELSEQEAKAAVFSHAGIAEDDVISLRIDKGSENGLQVYEIEFKTAKKSYDYDIVRSSGEILHSSYDVLGSESMQENTETGNTSSQTETSTTPSEESTSSATSPSSTPSETPKQPATSSQTAPVGNKTSSAAQGQTSNNASSSITKDQAKSIALKDAGVAENDTQFIWVKEDYDDGRAVYDVEFFANGTEYDYENDRSTGKIISSDFDIEHYTPSNGNTGGTVISADKASNIALAKVPGATANDIRIHLDRDDGRQIYEGEIYYNRMEYEFEIDASTGTIIEWSVEHWD